MTPQSVTPVGSARDLTRADTVGEKMELIPVRFYTEAGLSADPTPVGSARELTRAVSEGRQLELIPTLRWDDAG